MIRASLLLVVLLGSGAFAQAVAYPPTPNDPLDLDGLSVYHLRAYELDAGIVWTPAIGNPDGGVLVFNGSGVRLPNQTGLEECTSSMWFTQRRVNSQCWECNPILQAIGGPAGMWTYCGTPIVPFSTRSLQDPGGAGTPAGVHFNQRHPGTHYQVLGDLTVCVEATGTCTGGCPAGTHAILDVEQENQQDGGRRQIAVARIPCTAPLGYCVSTNSDPRNDAGTDAGIWGVVIPSTLGGHVHFEVRADGGQCSKYGVFGLTGWSMPGAFADGGGL